MELEFSILFLGTLNSVAAIKGEWHASHLCWGANETTRERLFKMLERCTCAKYCYNSGHQ